MSEESGAIEGEGVEQVTPVGGVEEGGKPEYVDEKFWNIETKAVDIEGLSKSYSELGTKIREKSDLMRETIKSEMEADKISNRPETANDYVVKIPEELSKEFSEDMNFEFNEADPMLAFWKEFSHEQGYGQDVFDSGLSAYISSQFAGLPDFDAEVGKLGDNGRDRAQHVNLWAQKNLSPEAYAAVEGFAVTADGVVALEEIMAVQGEPALSPGGPTGVGSSTSLNELRAMQADPRYWDTNKLDPEFIKKVDEGYERLVAAG